MNDGYEYQDTLDTSPWDAPEFSAANMDAGSVGQVAGGLLKKKKKEGDKGSKEDDLSYRSEAAKKSMRA